MNGRVTALYRYPVKGLSPEPMTSIDLAEGRGVPQDRTFALALAETAFDPNNPKPSPKTDFVVLMRFAELAALQTTFDDATSTLTLHRKDGTELASASLEAAEGRAAIEQAILDHLGSRLNAPPRVVRSNNHRFTDVSVISPELMEAVSFINLASVRAFEQRLGKPVDPMRFRANIYVDGLKPWVEFDWIERDLKLGDLIVSGALRTRRCAATEVDPVTAERDIKVPTELLRHFGHSDLGIYFTIKRGGTLRCGDKIEIPASN